MALTLHGNNGLGTTNGTAAAPSLAAPDNDTGFFFGTNLIRASTSGTERLSIDTTSVNIIGSDLKFEGNDQKISTGSSSHMLSIQGGVTNMGGLIELRGGSDTGDIRFFAQGATATKAERMRITKDGPHLLLGGTSDVNEITESSSNAGMVIGSTSYGNAGLAIITSTSGAGRLYFGDNIASDAGRNRGAIIYYHSSDHMHFQVAGSERLRIDSTGRVSAGKHGVGSYNDASEWFKVQSNDSAANISIVGSNDTHSSLNLGDEDDFNIQKIKSDHTNNSLQFFTDDGERVRISSAGNVGINETSPNRLLYISSNSGTAYSSTSGSNEAVLRLHNKNGTDNSGVNNHVGIEMYVANGATSVGMLSMVRTGNNTGDLTYKVRTGASAYAERFRIQSNGFTGVGTSSPKRHFHIHNSATATVGMMLTNAATGESNDSQGLQFKVASDKHAEISQMENSDMRFFTDGSERVRIDANGCVRVGNTATQTTSGNTKRIALGAKGSIQGWTTGNLNGLIQLVDNYYWDGSNNKAIEADHCAYLSLRSGTLRFGSTNSSQTAGQNVSGGIHERFRIDANGNVGIGVTAPLWDIHAQKSSGTTVIGCKNTSGNATVYIEASSGNTAKLELMQAGTGNFTLEVGSTNALMFKDDGAERVRIDSIGQLHSKLANTTDYGPSNWARTGTGNQSNSSQAFPDPAVVWENKGKSSNVQRFGSYIQSSSGGEKELYITIRNSSFYRITAKTSHNSTDSDVAMWLVYGHNSSASGGTNNRIVNVVNTSSGGFTCTQQNTHVNSHDSTIKIAFSGSSNQGLRALVEIIGGF